MMMPLPHLSSFSMSEVIKIVFLDFDGVFTDNSVYIDEMGLEHVRCSRYDGYGISSLINNGIMVHVITSESRPLAKHRCKKLGIPLSFGVPDKIKEANVVCESLELNLSVACYMGNDINDLGLLRSVIFPIVTADCHASLRNPSFYTTQSKGGYGCIRELSDFLVPC